jgi:hypothetical protein
MRDHADLDAIWRVGEHSPLSGTLVGRQVPVALPPLAWKGLAPMQREHRTPAAISVRSHTRRIDLTTPLPEEGSWMLLCIPEGSTDAQVLEWAAETLPSDAVDELREIIEREASAQ